jgi:hypothetical protein
VPIVTITKLDEGYFAEPCTEELMKNCRQLFPKRGITLSIAQVYAGIMKTCSRLTHHGPVGEAILQFVDWDIHYGLDNTNAYTAAIARLLQTVVFVRVDGLRIECAQRSDLPLRPGTLVTLRETSNFWLIEVS